MVEIGAAATEGEKKRFSVTNKLALNPHLAQMKQRLGLAENSLK